MAIILGVRFEQRQAGVAAGVLGLHLLAIMAWWSQQHGLPVLSTRTATTPITAWLIELPTNVPPQRQAAPQHAPVARQDSQALTDTQSRTSSETLAPSTAHDATQSAPAISTGIYAPMPGPPTPALNLELSRRALSSLAAPSFAAQSPFHGHLPATVESSIANAAAQTGPWNEERVDDDHIRFRRGNTCIMMERPRAATLDPFSDAAARMPWKASASDC